MPDSNLGPLPQKSGEYFTSAVDLHSNRDPETNTVAGKFDSGSESKISFFLPNFTLIEKHYTTVSKKSDLYQPIFLKNKRVF